MNDIQSYLDAFAYVVTHTEILARFSITLVVSIILGAFVLDRFKIWRWSIVMIVFLILTQFQVTAVLRELGLTNYQIAQPHIITILSGVVFALGSGIGYLIKSRSYLAYTEYSAQTVAVEIVNEVNGGAIENSDHTQPI